MGNVVLNCPEAARRHGRDVGRGIRACRWDGIVALYSDAPWGDGVHGDAERSQFAHPISSPLRMPIGQVVAGP